MNTQRILYLFTCTPLHVGAGTSVGAIDQPIIRERHTGFPVIPATSLKGTFADEWNARVKTKRKKEDGTEEDLEIVQRSEEGRWLFGETDANNAAAGALQFSEARLLAFPVRSAKGSFAWITCPTILRRAFRDGAITTDPSRIPTPGDEQAVFVQNGPLAIDAKIVLEEYTFTRTGDEQAGTVGQTLAALLDDPVWQQVASRLVILSDGMMSFFTQNACEVAQHVRIDDETGTAAGGALFNQENVPSETLFYSVLRAFPGRGDKSTEKTPQDALRAFEEKVKGKPFQFGGDASTGLGYCTVKLSDQKGA